MLIKKFAALCQKSYISFGSGCRICHSVRAALDDGVAANGSAFSADNEAHRAYAVGNVVVDGEALLWKIDLY